MTKRENPSSSRGTSIHAHFTQDGKLSKQHTDVNKLKQKKNKKIKISVFRTIAAGYPLLNRFYLIQNNRV